MPLFASDYEVRYQPAFIALWVALPDGITFHHSTYDEDERDSFSAFIAGGEL
jgi:hypothetical protein